MTRPNPLARLFTGESNRRTTGGWVMDTPTATGWARIAATRSRSNAEGPDSSLAVLLAWYLVSKAAMAYEVAALELASATWWKRPRHHARVDAAAMWLEATIAAAQAIDPP